MAVTAKRDDMRLIAVVLGEPTGAIRNQETSNLLDYGFNLYKVDLLKSKEEPLELSPSLIIHNSHFCKLLFLFSIKLNLIGSDIFCIISPPFM